MNLKMLQKISSRVKKHKAYVKSGGGRDGGTIHKWKNDYSHEYFRSTKVDLENGRFCIPGVALTAELTYLWVDRGLLR